MTATRITAVRKVNNMINVGLDMEFLPNDLTPTGLISLGLKYVTPTQEQMTYYAVNEAMDTKALHTGENAEWMVKNVWKHLPTLGRVQLDTSHPDVKDYGTIREEVIAFLYQAACEVNPESPSRDDVQLVVNCGAQDMVRLQTLTCSNKFSDMPPWIPFAADDVYRLKRKAYQLGLEKAELPVLDEAKGHHALHDANYELSVFEYIKERYGDI